MTKKQIKYFVLSTWLETMLIKPNLEQINHMSPILLARERESELAASLM